MFAREKFQISSIFSVFVTEKLSSNLFLVCVPTTKHFSLYSSVRSTLYRTKKYQKLWWSSANIKLKKIIYNCVINVMTQTFCCGGRTGFSLIRFLPLKLYHKSSTIEFFNWKMKTLCVNSNVYTIRESLSWLL